MHIVNEEPSLSRTLPLKKNNYSNCPLKKRPVPFMVKAEPLRKDVCDDFSEPENLSTKPQDLTRKSVTPSHGVALISTKVEPHSPERLEGPSLSFTTPYSGGFIAKSGPLEPLNLNTQSDVPAWPKPYYPSHYMSLNYYSPDFYNYEKYASQTPSPPRQNFFPIAQPKPVYASWERMSHVNECGLSPTSSTSSYGLYSQPPSTPEDLSSPGSVGSSSPPRTNKDSSPKYQCTFCNKSYTTYSGLSKHQQFHCSANEDSTAKKSFNCKHCDKVYFSLGALKMHIRTHTLPCKCKLCGKAFSRPWLLQGHIRTHTGEKPFTCPHCNRAFADRSNLRAHLQTHSEVKKYSCPTCSKTFSRMSLLTKHSDGGCPGFHTSSEDVYKQEAYST